MSTSDNSSKGEDLSVGHDMAWNERKYNLIKLNKNVEKWKVLRKVNDCVVSNSKKNCPKKLDSSQSSPLLFVKALIKHINVIAVSLCITYYIPQLDEVDETKEADTNKWEQSKSDDKELEPDDKKTSDKKSKLEHKSARYKDMHILVNEMFKSTSGFLKKYYSYYNEYENEENEFLCITVILVTTMLIACEITILQRKLVTENFKDKEKPSKDDDQILNCYQKNILYLLVTINSYMNTITDDAGRIIKFIPEKNFQRYYPGTIDHSYMRKSLLAIELINDLDHKYDEDYLLTMKKLNSPFLNLQAIFNTISDEKALGSDDSYNIDLIGLYHKLENEMDTNQSELSIEDNKSEIPSIETQKNWLNDLIYNMDIKITEQSKLAIKANKVEDIDLDSLEKKIGSILLGVIDRITEIRTHKGFKEYKNLQKYIDALRIQVITIKDDLIMENLLLIGLISWKKDKWVYRAQLNRIEMSNKEREIIKRLLFGLSMD
ncbi:7436_t:CDS:2, partial [Racocetra persica]